MSHPIHHITAIASDPKHCVHFYSTVLGLRLVKKTVNQDQTEAYHLFFGDRTGEPGMDLTFFTFPGVGLGRRGVGDVSMISLAVPRGSLRFWQKRFVDFGVKHEQITKVADALTLTFYDIDQQRLQLVEVDSSLLDEAAVWETPAIKKEQAIRCFYGARFLVSNRDSLEPILMTLGFQKQITNGAMHRYAIPGVNRAGVLEIEESATTNRLASGAGTVHHIAFQVRDQAELMQKRQDIIELGLYPTEVINRYYFQSVYFRTPAGILFELATNGPGFTADEPEADLGKKLALPPFLESYREEIESKLEPI